MENNGLYFGENVKVPFSPWKLSLMRSKQYHCTIFVLDQNWIYGHKMQVFNWEPELVLRDIFHFSWSLLGALMCCKTRGMQRVKLGLKLFVIHSQQQPLPLSWLVSKWEWAVTWQSSSPWIQAMLDVLTSLTTWRSCSVAWPWLLLTGSSLHRSCCTHRASELQRNWPPRLFHSSSK